MRSRSNARGPTIPAPPVHLPQAVLGHDVTLGEEQIRCVLRVDVGDTPFVAHDLDWLIKAGDFQLAVDRCERRSRQRLCVGG
jgi:hypothetical protein